MKNQINWKEKYYDLILEKSSYNKISLEALSLRNKNRPEKLYKYNSFKKGSLENLINDKIWLSNPLKYNDPFEFTEKNNFLHVLNDNIEKTIKKSQEEMTVCSFCESYEEILMWSHYADEHKGFCIEYDLKSPKINRKFLNYLHPVIYKKEAFDTTKQFIDRYLGTIHLFITGMTKWIDWKYENEWRYIMLESKESNLSVKCISKVFIGMKIKPQNRARIINICKKKNIPVFEAFPIYEEYKLKFSQIL